MQSRILTATLNAKQKTYSAYTYPASPEQSGNVHVLLIRQLRSRCGRKQQGPKNKSEENNYKRKIKAKVPLSTP
jgi:hypothetical protein